MKAKLIGIFVCTLLFISILPVTGIYIIDKTPLTTFNGKTLYVGGDGPGNYTKIQDAIDNASDGDTIFIYSGTYNLGDLIIINISIKIIGENKFNTVINGIGILINTSKVEIRDLTFQDMMAPIVSFSLFDNVNNITISNNIFKIEELVFVFGGVIIENSDYCTITDNTFINCSLTLNSYHNTVYNNTVNDKPLLYFERTSDEIIDDAGQVILVGCDSITIRDLELSNTFLGIQLFDCENCILSDNYFSSNTILALFINSNNNIISGNVISNNIASLVFGDCEGNKISKNSFDSNGINLIFIHSSSNLISYNNFKYGSTHVTNKNIIPTESHNTWTGNFWNRPRLLPVLIWNFKIIHFLRRIFIIPTSPDVDWRPAIKQNDIDTVTSYEPYQEREITRNRILTIPSLSNILKQIPMFKNLFSLINY